MTLLNLMIFETAAHYLKHLQTVGFKSTHLLTLSIDDVRILKTGLCWNPRTLYALISFCV
jgi:hypothetical protein